MSYEEEDTCMYPPPGIWYYSHPVQECGRDHLAEEAFY